MQRMTMKRGGLAARMLLAGGIAAAAGTATVVRAAPAAGETAAPSLERCIAGAWAEYNSCLMSTRWRWVCDLGFELAVAQCFILHSEDLGDAAK